MASQPLTICAVWVYGSITSNRYASQQKSVTLISNSIFINALMV